MQVVFFDGFPLSFFSGSREIKKNKVWANRFPRLDNDGNFLVASEWESAKQGV